LVRPKQVLPSLEGWGGVRSVHQRLKRSETLIQNREAVSYALLSMANTKLTDIMSWDEQGNIQVKPSDQIPEHALHAIKSIKVNERTDKNGEVQRTLDIELFDKVGVLRLLAKASGLLDNNNDEERPSVIGINIQSPEVIDVESNNG
jgi:hypothetical protein